MINNNRIIINMLGEFTITIGDVTISDKSNHSKKLWSSLEFLIACRNKEISQQDLVDAIWPGEELANPAGSLKTHMHRVRNLLTELNAPDINFITQSRGTYAWNSELDCEIDCIEFENLYNTAINERDETLKLELFKKALKLYKGGFLPKSRHMPWVTPFWSHYRSVYVNLVINTIELLLQKDDYELISDICCTAISLDPSVEDFHYHLINALYRSNNQQAALSHYARITTILYERYSQKPSERLQLLYKDIVTTTNSINTDLHMILNDLAEPKGNKGAFFCEYGIFRDIYQLLIRNSKRNYNSYFICLVTLTTTDGKVPPQDALNGSMDALKKSLARYLRAGDVFTRYSLSQYLLLLPGISDENGKQILSRINTEFTKLSDADDLILQYKLENTYDFT
ncbi:MAG: SARP family transcriptional regulator [Lachnospiraceae bacterium]|nr:SARP family transcriptional regulator [Lachnospiraceae bacterium]